MITQLKIDNFKCFSNLQVFEFSKLNLLTGINGRGKSSLLQSILLLSQSGNFRKVDDLKVILNGKHIDLGNYHDIKNSDTIRDEKILIEIVLDNYLKAHFKFGEDENDSLTAFFEESEITIIGNEEILYDSFFKEFQKDLIAKIKDQDPSIEVDENALLHLKDIYYNDVISKVHYICADRLGPVKYVDKISFSDFVSVGPRGEYTINVLAKDNLPLVDDRLYLGNDSKSLIQQTQEWLSYILEGATIDIRGRDNDSSILYMLINNRNNSYKYKPSNVGYGYSYILPLIVSGLLAKENEILIVENPEAHLHPRAQSRIAEFFTKVASCGVQVFIESHSEHILNGLRVNTLDPKISISNYDLKIHYFNEGFESELLTMDEKGKIPKWPNGFFDQQEIDLSSLFKLSR